MADLKDAIEHIDDANTGWMERNQKAIDAVKETTTDLVERIEYIESGKGPPGRPAAFDAEAHEHVKLFSAWLRSPKSGETNRKLSEFETHAKAVTIASNAGGGYAVPKEIGADIERLQLKLSPVRNLVKVSQAGTSDIHRLIDIGGAESGWRSESGTVSDSATPQLRDVVPTGGELYAYPKASNWSLQDIFFNTQTWLVESVAEAFAAQEGAAVVSGDGSSKPTGMLNTTPVTTDDWASPLREAAAYEYLPCLSASSPVVAEILPDPLIDLVYTVNSAYRANASWVMNSVTAGSIRKLKDDNGRFLWTDSLAAGQPNMLLGHPVSLWEDFQDIATNAFPVAFGDFRRSYESVDRSDIMITVDEVTVPGQTKFHVRKRVYGHVLNNGAIKFLRTTIA